MVGILDLLTGILGEQQPLTPQERFARMRLGGEDTPAGGGVLDAVGRRIMEQGPQAQAGQGILSMQEAPQQAMQAPQGAPAAPQVSMPSQGGGGLLARLFGGGGPSNQTVQYLMGKGYDESAARAIASDPDTLRSVVARVPQGPTDPLDAEYKRAQIENLRSQTMERGRSDARKTYGLQPQYGVDANGNPVLLQLGDDASAEATKMPEGVTLSKTPIKLDAGTHFILLDPITRQPVGQIEKNLAEAEAQKAAGKARGEDTGSYESLASKMPGLEKVVTDLDKLADEATYTRAGVAYDAIARQMGMEPREAAVARAKYIAMVDNQVLPLLRDTFGAQFTVQEGESLRATLGNPDLSPPEKQEVLKAFIEQKRRDVEALGRRTGQIAPGADRMGTAGEWTDVGNGVKIRRKQ